MRTIDGDKLIEWLDASLEDCINCKANTIAGITALNIDSFKRFIAEQPTIDQYGTWIPCSERLPEEPELCLITQKIGTQKVRKTALRSSGEWRFNGRKIKDEAVIAWMPLPEPYREEKDDRD